jgi:pyruvate/2-oxoglutarate/acetoin dehydrogenase E1 component
VTVVATGRLVHAAIEASALGSARVEVVDLQRLAPLDVEPVCRSLAKTSHLVIAHDEPRGGAMVALLEAAVYAQGYWLLDGPIVRVTAPPTPVPAAAVLEDAYRPTAGDIAEAISEAVGT